MKVDDDLCPHYLDLNFSTNFFNNEDTKSNIQLPYPISKPMKYSQTDIIKEFNDKLEEYNSELGLLHKDFGAVRNRIDQTFSGSHATITRGLLNVCNLEKKEAPFACDYNPYFSMGRLEHLRFGGHNYLITPDIKNNLYATNLSNPLKPQKLQSEKLPTIITGISSCSTNGNTFLLLKHSNDLTLLKFTSIDDIAQVALTKKFKRDILEAKINETTLGVILPDLKLRLYDIETREKTCIDEVVHFEFIDTNSVAILNKKLRISDQRSENEKVLDLDLSPCDYLCSLKTVDNILYLATRHHLIRTDLRFFKTVEFCSHLMKSSPCFMDLDRNYLCLASQSVKEKVVFSGDPIGSLPTHVPSVLDTLNRCRLKKDLLLKRNLGERLRMSVGGVKLIGDGGKTTLYTANSLGDIFKQEVSGFSSEETPIEALYSWINTLPSSPRPLHLTNVVNASEIKFSFNKRIEEKHLTKFTQKPKKIGYFFNHFKNRYQKDNMGELATNFLSIWDQEEEDREDVIVPEVAPLDKVNDWIDSQYFF